MMSKKTIFVGACLIFIAIGIYIKRNAIACDLIEYNTDFTQVSAQVYFHKDVDVNKHSLILERYTKAQYRVDQTFGTRIAQPKLIVASSPEVTAKFKTNNTGSSFFSVLGEQCIVLGEKGQNIDVMSHELVHAETGERLGLYHHLTKMPMWYNEGIALIVDYREPFILENIKLSEDQVEAVKGKFWGFQFFDGNNTHQNYLASRLAVKDMKPKTLYSNLEKIKAGQFNFD